MPDQVYTTITPTDITALSLTGGGAISFDIYSYMTTGFAEVSTAASAWWEGEPCYAPAAPESRTEQYISGLAPGIRAQTSAANEALHLAIRNAFIVLDGGSDAAHRTFGCLYGVERYGDNPVAIVPSSVSFATAIQKTLSALLIFVFGLAVRNMLRMK